MSHLLRVPDNKPKQVDSFELLVLGYCPTDMDYCQVQVEQEQEQAQAAEVQAVGPQVFYSGFDVTHIFFGPFPFGHCAAGEQVHVVPEELPKAQTWALGVFLVVCLCFQFLFDFGMFRDDDDDDAPNGPPEVAKGPPAPPAAANGPPVANGRPPRPPMPPVANRNPFNVNRHHHHR